MVGDRLALRDGAYRLVEVETGIPDGIPQFVGELVELLVVQRMRLVHHHQIEVGARPDLSTGEGADRAQSDAGGRHVERDLPAGVPP